MAEHFVLYYLFLEDKAAHPMPEEQNRQIRKNIEKFYQKIKPPPTSRPLTSIRENEPP